MAKFRGLLRASHFGPTLLVTSISIIFATFYHSTIDSFLIGLSIFSGQLVVGWSNDLIDFHDDLKHQRLKKPLVSQAITPRFLKSAILIDLPIALVLNLVGPLGLKGGGISLGGILIAVAYNLYFKFTPLSWLPYALAFGALPCAIVIASGQVVHPWMYLIGGLTGIAAHFINVLKDMEADRTSGIRGLPQVLGKKWSILLSAACITLAILITILTTILTTTH